MIVALLLVIILLLFAVAWLNFSFYKQKQQFHQKLQKLQAIIVEMSHKNNGNDNQLKLSEALDETLKNNRAVLSDQIFSLNRELFEILSKNNLLKK